MEWITKIVTIVMLIVNGQFIFSEPVKAPAPIVVEEETVIEEVVTVDVQGEAEEVYPDFRVVEYTDSEGVTALVPDLPASVSPEDNWALFWELNPDLLPKE